MKSHITSNRVTMPPGPMVDLFVYDYSPSNGSNMRGLKLISRGPNDTRYIVSVGYPDKHYKDILRSIIETHGVAPLGHIKIPRESLDESMVHIHEIEICYGDTMVQPKAIVYDIETMTTTKSFSNPDNPGDEIFIITAHFRGTYYAFVRHQVDDKEFPGHRIFTFEDEKSLLFAFVDWIYDVYPDIIVGFNNRHFDDPFIQKRINRYDKHIKFIPRYTISLDIFKYMVSMGHEVHGVFESYSLNNISKCLLNEEKSPVDFKILQHAFMNPKENMKTYIDGIKYGIRDTELTNRLWTYDTNGTMLDDLITYGRLMIFTPNEITDIHMDKWETTTVNTGVFNGLVYNNIPILDTWTTGYDIYSPEVVVFRFDNMVLRILSGIMYENPSPYRDSLLGKHLRNIIDHSGRMNKSICRSALNIVNAIDVNTAMELNMAIESIFRSINSNYPIFHLNTDVIAYSIPFDDECTLSRHLLNGGSINYIPTWLEKKAKKKLKKSNIDKSKLDMSTDRRRDLLNHYTSDNYKRITNMLYNQLPQGLVHEEYSLGGMYVKDQDNYYFLDYFDDSIERINRGELRRKKRFELYDTLQDKMIESILKKARPIPNVIPPIKSLDSIKECKYASEMRGEDYSKLSYITYRAFVVRSRSGKFNIIRYSNLNNIDINYYNDAMRDVLKSPSITLYYPIEEGNMGFTIKNLRDLSMIE